MELKIGLTEREVEFLRRLIAHHQNMHGRPCTIEDAIHECIRDAMFDEGESGL